MIKTGNRKQQRTSVSKVSFLALWEQKNTGIRILYLYIFTLCLGVKFFFLSWDRNFWRKEVSWCL